MCEKVIFMSRIVPWDHLNLVKHTASKHGQDVEGRPLFENFACEFCDFKCIASVSSLMFEKCYSQLCNYNLILSFSIYYSYILAAELYKILMSNLVFVQALRHRCYKRLGES